MSVEATFSKSPYGATQKPSPEDTFLQRVRRSRVITISGMAISSLSNLTHLNSLWNSSSAGGAHLLRKLLERTIDVIGQVTKTKPLINLAQRIKIVAIVSLPFAAKGMCTYGKNIIQGKNTAISGVYFAQSLGWFCDTSITVLSAVRKIPGVSPLAQSIIQQAIVPLGGVVVGAGIVGIGWHGYGIKCAKDIQQDIPKYVNESTDEELLDTFGLDQEDDAAGAVKLVKEAAADRKKKSALEGRAKSKIIYHSLAIVALTVSTVAMVVLMVNPVGIVGTSLLVIGTAVSLSAALYDMRAQHNFEKKIGIEQDKWKKFAFIAGVVSLIAIPVVAIGGFAQAKLL